MKVDPCDKVNCLSSPVAHILVCLANVNQTGKAMLHPCLLSKREPDGQSHVILSVPPWWTGHRALSAFFRNESIDHCTGRLHGLGSSANTNCAFVCVIMCLLPVCPLGLSFERVVFVSLLADALSIVCPFDCLSRSCPYLCLVLIIEGLDPGFFLNVFGRRLFENKKKYLFSNEKNLGSRPSVWDIALQG